MRMKLLTLSVGVAMLGSVGLAQAETKAPVVTSTKTQMETTKVAQAQTTQRVALSDEQLGNVTAGHRWYEDVSSLSWHWGYVDIYWGGSWSTYYAYHRG
jgi:hypothetical protein